MSNTPSLGALAALARQLDAGLQSLIESTPISFGPAVLVNITPVPSPFGPLPPYTLVFQSVAGGPSVAILVSTKPVGLAVGATYTGSYTPGAEVDTLNSLVPSRIEISVVVIDVSIVAPFRASFVPLVGGVLITLNFGASLPAGIVQGARISFGYIPASASGTGFDQIVGSVTTI